MDFMLVMFQNNTLKMSEILNKGNLLTTCLKITNSTNLQFCRHFHYGENKNIRFFFKSMSIIKLFFLYIVTTNGFKLNHNYSLQIYICVKRQAKMSL